MLRSQGWAIIMVSCLVILLSAVQKTNAGVICSNLGPGGAFDHTQNHHIGSTGDTSEVVANSFIPLNDAIFSDAVVALSAGASLQQVQISLETDSLDTPGVPGGILEQFTVTVPAKSASLITAASVLNSPLTGGDMYWLVVSPSDPQHTVAGWDFNPTGDVQTFAFNESGSATGPSWSTNPADTRGAFQIDSIDSPKPTSLTLVVMGLASFGGIAWLKTRKSKVSAT